jgi:hypothetical protein
MDYESTLVVMKMTLFGLMFVLTAWADAATPAEVQLTKGTEFGASVVDNDGEVMATMRCRVVGCWWPPCWECTSPDNSYIFEAGGYDGVSSPDLEGSLQSPTGTYTASCPKVNLDQVGHEVCSLSTPQ